MTKETFRNNCKAEGYYTSIDIELALWTLLKQQPNNTIEVPKKNYIPKDQKNDSMDEEFIEACFIEHLEELNSIYVNNVDSDFSESYIRSIRIESNNVIINVYQYYESDFIDRGLYDLEDRRDAMKFALKYAIFDKPDKKSYFNDEQIDLIEEFIHAADKLNKAGVSLIWDNDRKGMYAANRDTMQDNSFYRLEEREELPEDAVSLNKTLTDAINIELSYMDEDYDLYYFENKES